MKKKVVIGMSGGVDSSVAAILLKQQGYEVIGLFMRNWDSSINNDYLGNPNLDKPICPQESDYNDALAVCKKLDIPLYRVDFIKEYWDFVFTYFLDELKKGRTPNPDIMCNKYIKFDLFVKEAKKLGADFIATGHYAKIENGRLMRSHEHNKDQTYFLSQVSKEQLQNVLFPLGDIKDKKEVREIASKYGLVTAKKKDSTGICFIGERNFKNFLKNYLPNKKGNIVNIDTNEILGHHKGIWHYTVGQRKGLGIAYKEPLFVVSLDSKTNTVYVGNKNHTFVSEVTIYDVNWIVEPRDKEFEALVKTRSAHKGSMARVIPIEENVINIKFFEPTGIVAKGQSCVCYDEDITLCGGVVY